MKHLAKRTFLCLFAIVASLTSFGQDKEKLAAEAKEYEAAAMQSYMRMPDSAISNFKQAAELFARAGNYRAAAASLQNGAFVYDDYRKDSYKAAGLMKESLVYWRKTTDTAAIAEAYKYTIRQHARFNDAMSVSSMRDTAIGYFTALSDYNSISELYLITATMYEGQRLPDSAIRYALLAREISPRSSKPELTMFRAENVLFREYVVANRYKEAKPLVKKLQKNIQLPDLSKEDKKGFYYYAWIYANNTKSGKKATEFKTEYDDLRNSTK